MQAALRAQAAERRPAQGPQTRGAELPRATPLLKGAISSVPSAGGLRKARLPSFQKPKQEWSWGRRFHRVPGTRGGRKEYQTPQDPGRQMPPTPSPGSQTLAY